MTIDLSQEISVEIGLDEPDDAESLRALAAKTLGVSVTDLPEISLKKRSIDARKGRVRFRLVLGFPDPSEQQLGGEPPREVKAGQRVLIVGGGPAGLFCAYQLARVGIASCVIERGKQVQPRRHDLAGLQKEGRVDPDSNYCFGEGGAGTYSDGKLYTRSHKRGDVRDVLEVLALHDAPRQILTDARPHIGSNRLPKVVTAMRERLEGVGVDFLFEARVTDLLVSGVGGESWISGVRLQDGRELQGDAVVLAAGHSARDVLELLVAKGVTLEPKAFAMGVRIEHPQPLINEIQYGRFASHPKLPAAAYSLAHTENERGVFSFCMCPGGWVVPASTEPDGLVINGMSLSRRDSPYANSGLVVGVEVADLDALGFKGPLAGIEAQRKLERTALLAGGSMLKAPATRVTDFLAKKASSTAPKSSYLPGLTPTNVADVLDAVSPNLSQRLRDSLRVFGKNMRGYLTEEAVLIGVESRTSSPVRVPRDPESLQSPHLARLYPCGEGAGFAGGIVSAAMDGVRVARAVARALH